MLYQLGALEALYLVLPASCVPMKLGLCTHAQSPPAAAGNDLLDILAGANASVTDTVAYIGMTLDALYEAGARRCVIALSGRL